METQAGQAWLLNDQMTMTSKIVIYKYNRRTALLLQQTDLEMQKAQKKDRLGSDMALAVASHHWLR